MNSLDYVLGRKPLKETTTTSAVPVVATVPSSRKNFRSRPYDDDEDEPKRKRARMSSTVRAVLGESEDDRDTVIPDDAEKVDDGDLQSQALGLKKTKENPPDPDKPKDHEEKLLTPRTALVAPDVTPHSMTEIDPSEVPQASTGGETFKTKDIKVPAEAPSMPAAPPAPGSGDALSILLGRTHAPQHSTGRMPGGMNPPVQAESTQPISEADAVRLFNKGTGSPEDYIKKDVPMPEHVPGDGKTVFEAARRFI